MMMFGIEVLVEVRMNEGCRVPMIFLIMNMEQWGGEQRAKHRHDANESIEPSHAGTILVHLERGCQRNNGFKSVGQGGIMPKMAYVNNSYSFLSKAR